MTSNPFNLVTKKLTIFKKTRIFVVLIDDVFVRWHHLFVDLSLGFTTYTPGALHDPGNLPLT